MSITLDRDGHVAIVTISRPERLNTLDMPTLDALRDAWIEIRDDDTLRAVVLTGAGDRAFCAGADLRDFLPRPHPLRDLWNPGVELRPDRGLDLYKPVVAAVNGYCLGGGLTLMLATDLRVAAEHATFATPEVGHGILASCGGTQRLAGQLPRALAMELLLTGDAIDAATALRWGLVNQVVPADQVLPTALGLAHRISRNAPMAVQATKELALRSGDMDTASGLRLEDAMVRLLQDSEDFAEGVKAFAERRPAEFQGR
ncbi:enoyl-CoA hydratase/isomerase family protein [Streptomyces sp. NBC_01476]|uniref:enoyl-CoA hydratase/isomerase family protein n=1 Tax=Streptomyces sp. NBC_01476 TaxID=2903881 RepID=UPI002E3293EB|nr:enoyl-CoA hydratase/isomerase family protein [Streptomyces sp. NBC_01476]